MQEICETFHGDALPVGFYWFNEPAEFRLDDGLELVTKPKSDFWQRTHCGFRRDDGHCLLTKLEGDFAVMTRVEYEFLGQYDQCGLMIRVDEDNWIKLSTEWETDRMSRLGSVVTNLGYSDWASQDVSSEIQRMSYRISRSGQDFLLEASLDGNEWNQLRVAHLHRCRDPLEVGIYACSPKGNGFKCRFRELAITGGRWGHEVMLPKIE